MPHDATIPNDEDPTHMLIWLDKGIGNPNRYQHLKKAFSTTADPKNETPLALIDKDFDNILRAEGPLPIHFEGIWFLLAAFKDVERCIDCFERNQHRRIFFIVSGSLGEEAVPKVLKRFLKTFTDPISKNPYTSIYVFCHNIEMQMEWALSFRDYIQIFNFDADLLSRMVRDIADNFLVESKRLLDKVPLNSADVKHRLTWSHILYQRYSEMENTPLKKEFNEVNALLDHIDDYMTSSLSDEV
ncbi:hypothetical protein I4U23_007237 [Adineta vaga]|nr:hypothetical protein I4U23_007237 [Adineta vaga]